MDSGGEAVWKADYVPFSEATVDPSSTIANAIRFPGQYYDQETGLHYNYHRYYDPTRGRYLTPDPLNLANIQIAKQNFYTVFAASLVYQNGLQNPQLLIAYQYAHNNAINLVDPLGLYLTLKQRIIVSMVIGAGAIMGGLAVGATSWGIGTPVGAAAGSALLGAAAASLLGGDLVDVGNAAISGLSAGYVGVGIGNLMTAISRTAIQAAVRTGVMTGAVEAILLESESILRVEGHKSPCQ